MYFRPLSQVVAVTAADTEAVTAAGTVAVLAADTAVVAGNSVVLHP